MPSCSFWKTKCSFFLLSCPVSLHITPWWLSLFCYNVLLACQILAGVGIPCGWGHIRVIYIYIYLFIIISCWGCPVAYGVLRPGIRSKPQLRPKPQPWQCQILNPLYRGWELNLHPSAPEMSMISIVSQQELHMSHFYFILLFYSILFFAFFFFF